MLLNASAYALVTTSLKGRMLINLDYSERDRSKYMDSSWYKTWYSATILDNNIMLLQWKEKKTSIYFCFFFFSKTSTLADLNDIFFLDCFQSFFFLAWLRLMINECLYILSWVFLVSKCLLSEICVILVSNQIRDWDLFSPSVIGYHNRVRGINPCSRDDMRPSIG